jgi:hypothetical protein
VSAARLLSAACGIAVAIRQWSRAEFSGLMTIGRLDDTPKDDCFQVRKRPPHSCLLLTCAAKRLVECRDAVVERFKLSKEAVELSMGMSGDFELAVWRSLHWGSSSHAHAADATREHDRAHRLYHFRRAQLRGQGRESRSLNGGTTSA